jgi:hypothetical protein
MERERERGEERGDCCKMRLEERRREKGEGRREKGEGRREKGEGRREKEGEGRGMVYHKWRHR